MIWRKLRLGDVVYGEVRYIGEVMKDWSDSKVRRSKAR